MCERNGRWRATYTPGSWVVLSGPTLLVLMPPAAPKHSNLLLDIWSAVLRSSSILELTQLLSRVRLDSLPNFGVFFWADGQMRSVVRGSVRVHDHDTGELLASAEGIQTWSEIGFGDVQRFRVEVEPHPEESLALPVVTGVVTASSIIVDSTDEARLLFPVDKTAQEPSRSEDEILGRRADLHGSASVSIVPARAVTPATPEEDFLPPAPGGGTELPPEPLSARRSSPSSPAILPEEANASSQDFSFSESDRRERSSREGDTPLPRQGSARTARETIEGFGLMRPDPLLEPTINLTQALAAGNIQPVVPGALPVSPTSHNGQGATQDSPDIDSPEMHTLMAPPGAAFRVPPPPPDGAMGSETLAVASHVEGAPAPQTQHRVLGEFAGAQASAAQAFASNAAAPSGADATGHPWPGQAHGGSATTPTSPGGIPPSSHNVPGAIPANVPPIAASAPPRSASDWAPSAPPLSDPLPPAFTPGTHGAMSAHGPTVRPTSEFAAPGQGGHHANVISSIPSFGSVTEPPPAAPIDTDEGDTIFATGIAATHKAMSGQSSHSDLVLAAMCNRQHPNPPDTKSCLRCGATVDTTSPQLVNLPTVAAIRSSSGGVVGLEDVVLVGRAPSAQPTDHDPTLMTVPSPNQDISRTHLRIAAVQWDIVVTDLHSTNGTMLLIPQEKARRMAPGDPVTVEIGAVLDLGDGIALTIEHPH